MRPGRRLERTANRPQGCRRPRPRERRKTVFVRGKLKDGCGGPQQIVPASLLGGGVNAKRHRLTEVPYVLRPSLG